MDNFETKLGKIINSDCFDYFPEIEDRSIDLIIADYPYNIKKDKWDKIKNYEDWMFRQFKEAERVLKDNGSFYWFHNDMPTISKLMCRLEETDFVFKQFIVWNKRFDGVGNKGFLDGYVEVGGLRNFQKMSEYILYYTFQDETGLMVVNDRIRPMHPFANYLKSEFDRAGCSNKEIAKLFPSKTGGLTGCVSNWLLGVNVITKKQYLIIRNYLNNEYLRKEYDDLRKEYDDLRCTFNNQKTHHSIWDYEIAKKVGHLTPKPLNLIKNIIKHSSNEGDLILDPTAGVCTTGLAAEQLNREWTCIEKEKEYCEKGKQRIEVLDGA